jgi:hypothetical protein
LSPRTDLHVRAFYVCHSAVTLRCSAPQLDFSPREGKWPQTGCRIQFRGWERGTRCGSQTRLRSTRFLTHSLLSQPELNSQSTGVRCCCLRWCIPDLLRSRWESAP